MEGERHLETLSEEQLKRMSRDIKTALPTSQDGETIHDHIKGWRDTIEHLLRVASRADLAATHRVAAWNTLCAVIDQCVINTDTSFNHELLWKGQIWYRLLSLYLEHAQHARPKSSKQLLSTLSDSWLRTESSLKNEDEVANQLVSVLFDSKDDRRTKASLQALNHFMMKNVLFLHTLLPCLSGNQELTPDSVSLDINKTLLFQAFLTHLFQLARQRELGSVVGQLVAILLDRLEAMTYDEDEVDGHPIFWGAPLTNAIEADGSVSNEVRLHILPVLFKRRTEDVFTFLRSSGLNDLIDGRNNGSSEVKEDGVLCAAMQCGKEMGLLVDTDERTARQSSDQIFIPISAIRRLLRSHSSIARLTGLSFLISSPSSTRPLTAKTLQTLQRYLHIFMGDTDANFRGELASLVQKLFDRMRASIHAVNKQAYHGVDVPIAVKQSQCFMLWFLRFIKSELRPTANYQHHISALRCLSAMIRSGVDRSVKTNYLSKSAALGSNQWPFNIDIMTATLRRLLLDLLMDPFDDVRQASSTMLSTYAGNGIEERHDICAQLSRTIDYAERSILVSGRADHADGVAHLYSLLHREQSSSSITHGPQRSSSQPIIIQLIERMEQALSLARASLTNATGRYPLHGILISLRYIILQPGCHYHSEDIPQRLKTCLQTVWEIVRPVLCNDAPEGHQLDDPDDAADSTSKDTLSYCWRALKESSLLMSTMVSDKGTDEHFVSSLSHLCFTQLAELRHRGAFSTVAQTWIVCCLRCRNVKTDDGKNLLGTWFNQVLDIMNVRTVINTRRSAGLPSLICGLLIADDTGESIANAFQELTAISRSSVDTATLYESSLPQVHALNCIKDVLKNTRLGEQSERYIAQSLSLAADSLRSEAWAVRNCGLMLFRAVIDRLLGTSEAHLEDDRPGSRIDTNQHPDLLITVINILQYSSPSMFSGNEGIFPALQLLQNIDLPPNERARARQIVFRLTASPSWHIRQKAARVYAIFYDERSPSHEIIGVFETTTASTNAIHGALLCLKQIASRFSTPESSSSPLMRKAWMHEAQERSSFASVFLNRAIDATLRLHRRSACPVIKAECVEVWTEYMRTGHSRNGAQGDLLLKRSEDQLFRSFALEIECEIQRMRITASGGDPIIRRSIARALAVATGFSAFGDGDCLHGQLVFLKDADAGACAVFFENMQRQNVPNTMTSAVQKILLDVVSGILSARSDVHLRCVTLQFLLFLHDAAIITEENRSSFVNAIAASAHPLLAQVNQHFADQWLQSYAISLEYRVSGSQWNGNQVELRQGLGHWISLCTSAIAPQPETYFTHSNPLQSREAAALAISRITSLWSHLNNTSMYNFKELGLAVFDLLNDDDEDIRTLAAQITNRIVHVQSPERRHGVREPTEARFALLRFFLNRFGKDQDFAREALNRAFGVDIDRQQLVNSFFGPDSEDETLHTGTSLFAEEKQNLYIDESVEARAWSKVALQIDPFAIHYKDLRNHIYWVSCGLDAMNRKIGNVTDGPLGWSSRPIVFTLGLQIIYGAELILHIAHSGRKVSIRPSKIRSELVGLQKHMAKNPVNDLWMREIRRVLEEDVIRKVMSNGRLLNTVLCDIHPHHGETT